MGEIEDVNAQLNNRSKRAVIGSIDAIALYPSLRIEESAKLVGEAIEQTRVKFQNIDYRAALIFLAVMLNEEEKLQFKGSYLIPKRVTNKGSPATIMHREITSDRVLGEVGEGESMWEGTPRLAYWE